MAIKKAMYDTALAEFESQRDKAITNARIYLQHPVGIGMAGLTNRDQAKTFIYAFMYGAGASKIGQIVGAGAKEGQILIDKFLNSMPALKRVRDSVTKDKDE